MCPISLDWFTDPVVTPSGHTYERADLEEWIERHGTEPQTRETLTIRQLYPNIGLLATQDYYRRHHLKFSLLL